VGALGRIINATLVSSLFPIFVSESGCPGPHGSPLVSQYALSAVKRMIFTSRCLPFVSYLSPSTLWMLWACFLLFSHYALGALGRMILHLSPTCLLLVSYLSPACVLVRSGCFAPHDFFPQTVLGGSTFIGLRSWVTWFCLCLRACVRGRTILRQYAVGALVSPDSTLVFRLLLVSRSA